MNDNFFGQYSVFCVFGSVVGCVVVPLIAQVLQQQSMECVILSAIVISLTAAHLNKKGGTDGSKLLLAKEVDRKKLNHNSNTKKQKHQTIQLQTNNENTVTDFHIHQEHEFMQQQQQQHHHEHLKVVEMERRNEEKRLKKLKKREEKIKKREEEHKKQKELEERNRHITEKRQKPIENLYRTTNSSCNLSLENFEKYCQSESNFKNHSRQGLSTVDEKKPRKQTYSYNQRIPRFERSRAASTESAPSNKSYHYVGNKSLTGSLTIGCSSLSTSCSSLSSIGSSGSSSPPLPASPPPYGNNLSPWKVNLNSQSSPSKPKATWTRECVQCPIPGSPLNISNGSPFGKNNSSSLFSTQQDQCGKVPSEVSFGGEYSLFGPQKFTNILPKSPVMC